MLGGEAPGTSIERASRAHVETIESSLRSLSESEAIIVARRYRISLDINQQEPVPAGFQVIAELPRNEVGKVLARPLVDQIGARS